MNNSWIVTLEEDENGDIIIPFPEEMIRRFGWQEGDEVEWDITEENVVIINTSAKQREDNIDKA